MRLVMERELSLTYAAKITPQEGGFVVTFRDLKNVFTEGDNYQEAISNAHQVLDILLADMLQDGLRIPVPTACRRNEVLIAVSPEIAAPILLHKLRQQKHYSISKVARSMGISNTDYEQLEFGKRLTLKNLKLAADALGATVELRLHAINP